MNSTQLFDVIGEAQDAYLLAALQTREGTVQKPRPTLKRGLLIAALAALMLLLVGCTVVYVLRLQDMSIGQQTYTQKFDDSGKAIDPVEKTRDILTPYGLSSEPMVQALTEWLAFTESYDPDFALMPNETDIPGIPNQYEYTYGCYTQEMVDKVDEIAAKYGLQLLDTDIVFQQYQSDIFLEETGIGSLLLQDSNAKIQSMAGVLYPPYNFKMEFLLTTLDCGILPVTLHYSGKDYFPHPSTISMDLTDYEQWDYTAADGTSLLLALSSKGAGYVIAQRSDAVLTISVDGNFSGSMYPAEDEIITKAELEAIADQFDYSIQPVEIDRETVETRLAEAEAANAYVPETYSGFNDYLTNNVRIYSENRYYAFYDVNGDGAEELLLGSQDGRVFPTWLALLDGQVTAQSSNFYLCQGNVVESVQIFDDYDSETHWYYHSYSDTALFGPDGNPGDPIIQIQRDQSQWTSCQDFTNFTDTEISEVEAQSIMAQYPRIELDWKPLMAYPLDDAGSTLGSYIQAKDVRVSDDELVQIYADFLNAKETMYYTHYRLLDVNGDGVKDLLVSGDGEKYWNVLTYRYGFVSSVASMDFYICEDGILERCYTQLIAGGGGVEQEYHQFLKLRDFQREELDYLIYDKATDTYYADKIGTVIPRDEAEAILAKYTRIDQDMHPISQLLN